MAQIRIFTTAFCPFCYRAKKLLREKGFAFEEIDVTFSAAKREEMTRLAGSRTVPQIFHGDRHIGDCDDLFALDATGDLDGILEGGAA